MGPIVLIGDEEIGNWLSMSNTVLNLVLSGAIRKLGDPSLLDKDKIKRVKRGSKQKPFISVQKIKKE